MGLTCPTSRPSPPSTVRQVIEWPSQTQMTQLTAVESQWASGQVEMGQDLVGCGRTCIILWVFVALRNFS